MATNANFTELADNANYMAHCAKQHGNWRHKPEECRPMEIGQIIRAIRKKRGETLEQLAFAVGTDPSNLSRIERGVQQPSSESLRLIAEAFGTTVAALYASVEGVHTLSKETPQMLGADEADYTEEAIKLRLQFRTLTPDNQHALLEIAKVLNRLQRNKR